MTTLRALWLVVGLIIAVVATVTLAALPAFLVWRHVALAWR